MAMLLPLLTWICIQAKFNKITLRQVKSIEQHITANEQSPSVRIKNNINWSRFVDFNDFDDLSKLLKAIM